MMLCQVQGDTPPARGILPVCVAARILKFSCLCVVLWGMSASGQGDYFPYLYQRTTYTDNLLMPGAWWSNPAAAAEIPAPYAHTANVLPLGDSLLISSFRLFVPLIENVVAGAGLLGAGGYTPGSSSAQAGGGELRYASRFAFSRPRFQLGAAARFPFLGSAGVLGTIGTDRTSESESSATPGFGFGWLSPSLLGIIQVSGAMMFIYHSLDKEFWESAAKLGLRFASTDTLFRASAEYTVSAGERGHGFGVFTALSDNPPEYDVFKTLVSARIYRNLAAMAGYSIDIDYDFSNWHLAHVGLELQESGELPFLGGYDLGFRFGDRWLITHRIWLGLNFKTLKDMQKDGK
ncbi:MAG: hypothetical protein GF418_16270 [Chitinivibrionales bacterium]|nr:hypothetical protein [Chitinivibrionales bacterium]MBD3397177.1 hypothetical protein [Chitinivibrionales bacterium]